MSRSGQSSVAINPSGLLTVSEQQQRDNPGRPCGSPAGELSCPADKRTAGATRYPRGARAPQRATQAALMVECIRGARFDLAQEIRRREERRRQWGVHARLKVCTVCRQPFDTSAAIDLCVACNRLELETRSKKSLTGEPWLPPVSATRGQGQPDQFHPCKSSRLVLVGLLNFIKGPVCASCGHSSQLTNIISESHNIRIQPGTAISPVSP